MTDTSNMIFVFGSNLAGRHGAGAARYAKERKRAVYGQAVGLQGQSYAIPTKDASVYSTLSLRTIRTFVDDFIRYATEHPEMQFQITCIGCGLAGLNHSDIAPMFKDAPVNCFFDTLWDVWLPEKQFWGTFY